MEYIIEIRRDLKVKPKLYKEFLEEYFNGFNEAMMPIYFEKFQSINDRDYQLTCDGPGVHRYFEVKPSNIVDGAFISEFDLDDESDLYYAKVIATNLCDTDFSNAGVFAPRLFGTISDGVMTKGRLVALDYIHNVLKEKR